MVLQVTQWQKEGHDCCVFVRTHTTSRLSHSVTPNDHGTTYRFDELELNMQQYKGLRGYWSSKFKLIKSLAAWRPDFVYTRIDGVPSLMTTFALWKYKSAVEINTDDIKELRTTSSFFRRLQHRLTRFLPLMSANGHVYVTQEIAELKSFSKFNCLRLVSPNGILLNDFPSLSSSGNKTPHFAFLGSANHSWHGIDKICTLAKIMPAYHFHIIGPTKKQLGEEVPSNVSLYGFLEPKEYHDILRYCDVAIGTLAMHRNQMNEGSTLKVREYLALGLAVVIGYVDSDFPEDKPFLLNLPNQEENVSEYWKSIVEFGHTWTNRRVERKLIGVIDAKVKEQERLAFFKTLLLNGN